MRYTVILYAPESRGGMVDDETAERWFHFDVDDRPELSFKDQLEVIAGAAEKLRFDAGEGAVIQDLVAGGFMPPSYYEDPWKATLRFEDAPRPLNYKPTDDEAMGGG